MAHLSPMVSIPKKSTDEADWTTPIRNAISHSYGEDPDNYATECANLQRCRQDAVKGAGSDMTARDLLYKYFGQLELLELRFAEIRVNFPWRDAFTNKLITQTSIAYEKASIIFQIAATHSAIAASQNRADPEGLKRAFYYFRTCAGMLTYINDNFLHAPSTDLSREVVKFLVGIIMAQATEVFFEKCTDEKKGNALVAKIAAQAAFMYTSLSEEVKEFMGKGIFDRNWVTVIQAKAKYFTSLAQFHRGLADSAAGKHGDALVRFTVAETAAKEANRSASSFASTFVTQMSPNLPPDAGSTLLDLTKTHLALCTDKKNTAQRENDLIYNAVLPAPEALPQLEKAAVATPITIQEVYASPDVQKVIGTDMFVRLIPLSVHESASVYSEEKAKLVRSEVEKADNADAEVKSALESLGVKQGLVRFKAIAEGGVGGGDEVPVEVRRWREDISVMEEREGADSLIAQLNKLKEAVKAELDGISRELEVESKNCEAMRVKYDHLWTQAPSASLTKPLRQDLKAHNSALEAAAQSDQQVVALWESVKSEIRLLLSPQVEEVFRASTEGTGAGSENLLDLDVTSETRDEEERVKIAQLVDELEERLGRLNKIAHERTQVLKDLKEKVQSDDVSHLLLLNRRNSGIENSLFAGELEKFKPYQQRLAATVQHEQLTLEELSTLWHGLRDLAGRGPGAKKWEERERRKKDTIRRFSRARDGYMEVRDGLAKGLQFYSELTELTTGLKRNVKSFVSERASEREALAAQAETERRLSQPSVTSSSTRKPPLPPPPPRSQSSSMPPGFESSFASMNLQGSRNGPLSPPLPPPPPGQNSWMSLGSAPTAQYPTPPPLQPSRTPYPPPPTVSPPQPSNLPYPPPASGNSTFQGGYAPSAPPLDPYASLSMFGTSSSPSPHSTRAPQPPPARPPQQYPTSQQQQQPPPFQQEMYAQSAPSIYSQPQHQPLYPPPSQPSYANKSQHAGSLLPPPPPPISYQSQYASPSPPVQQQSAYHYQGDPPQQQPYDQYSQGYSR
ncbi:BRO1-domain-containing protein [Laetiporus sulphureus 93-53]|uniref:BRO domain-containing protein 1 n=1 Tax=Laetiporus sulphureus 93-53 TaxID=1314785 RepID=A0A165DI12_9APHY|nr:BRO1-domain-containing protein [Laetiporus sulphureus 93-53]KZT04928.1 BRO1-domain-containing protein [Laetiporus sulphureus 93-53]